MLNTLAGATTGLFIVAGFCVGLRLLWMGRTTRGVPELSLGTGLFLIVGLGLPLQLSGIAIIEANGDLLVARWLVSISTVFMNAGWAAIWFFTWRVFRRESAATRAVVFGAFIALAALSGLSIVAGMTGNGVRAEDAIVRTLVTVVLSQILYVWTAGESLTWWRRMRKRVGLGLADPVVANRFLLWGIVGVLSFVSLLAPLVFTAAGMDYQQSATGRLLTAVSGLGCAVALWLAFMPPHAYLRHVRSAGVAAAS